MPADTDPTDPTREEAIRVGNLLVGVLNAERVKPQFSPVVAIASVCMVLHSVLGQEPPEEPVSLTILRAACVKVLFEILQATEPVRKVVPESPPPEAPNN